VIPRGGISDVVGQVFFCFGLGSALPGALRWADVNTWSPGCKQQDRRVAPPRKHWFWISTLPAHV